MEALATLNNQRQFDFPFKKYNYGSFSNIEQSETV